MHNDRAQRAPVADEADSRQTVRVPLFFTVSTCLVRSRCRKPIRGYAQRPHRLSWPTLAYLWRSAHHHHRVLRASIATQIGWKPVYQNATVLHSYNLLQCTKGAANMSKMVPRVHMNDFNQSGFICGGLSNIIVLCWHQVLIELGWSQAVRTCLFFTVTTCLGPLKVSQNLYLMASWRSYEWIWPVWHHSCRSAHHHRKLRALITGKTGWSQTVKMRLFFITIAWFNALTVPQTCLKWYLKAMCMNMTSLTPLA